MENKDRWKLEKATAAVAVGSDLVVVIFSPNIVPPSFFHDELISS